MIMTKVINALLQSKKIGISFHASPDGDSIGSALALMLGLKKLNKEVYILSQDKAPELFAYLPCLEVVNTEANYVKEGTDCIVVLDCGSFERISAKIDNMSNEYTVVNIDHHLSNELYGHINFVDTEAASVGEIVYKLLKSLNVVLDNEIATCIYTSIVSDTGGFKYSNTTTLTHNIASELLSLGVDFTKIHRVLFQDKKFNRLKLIGKVLDSMYLCINDRLCIMRLTREMLNHLSIEASDTSDLISYGIDIDSVEVAALIKETENGVKVSLRSKSFVDVRKVAEEFGGGGHIRAAGLSLNTTVAQAEKIVLNVFEKELI